MKLDMKIVKILHINYNQELPDVEPPWFSMPTEGEYSSDLEDGTPYDVGYKVDEE